MISHLNLPATNALPTDIFMMIDDILENLYPPHQEDVASSLQLLCTLKTLFLTAPSGLLVPLLKSIQKGLCVWIEDKDETVPESDYNDVVSDTFSHGGTCTQVDFEDNDSLRRFTRRTSQSASLRTIA